MRTLALIVTCFVSATAYAASPLADRLPPDTVFYVGWAGGDVLADRMDGTHAQAVLAESNIEPFLSDTVPALIQRLPEKDAREGLLIVSHLLSTVWTRPTAIAMRVLETDESLVGQIILVCDAGDRADEFENRIMTILGEADAPPEITVTREGNLVIVGSADMRLVAAGRPSLAGADQFKTVMAKLPESPASMVYADVTRSLALIDRTVAMTASPEAQTYWPRVRDALGVNGVQAVGFTGNFEDKLWVSQTFVSAPADADGNRVGLFSSRNDAPLGTDVLSRVPKNTSILAATTFDPEAFVATVREITSAIDPKAREGFERGMSAANAGAGANVEREIINPLGHEWAAYVSDEVGGSSPLGVVVVHKPDNAAKLKDGLVSMSFAASNTLNLLEREIAKEEGVQMRFDGRSARIRGVEVYYLDLPLITPSWAVHDGYLYLGFYPQTVATAATLKTEDGNAIADNPAYQKMKQLLGREIGSSVTFVDEPALAVSGYTQWLMISRLVEGGAAIFDNDTPPPVWPTLPTIRDNLVPAGSTCWSDADGFYVRKVQGFPGSGLIANPQVAAMVGGASSMTSVALPSLARARDTANNIKSMSNLRQIGTGMHLYAIESRDEVFPKDLGELYLTQDLDPSVFLSPRQDRSLPRTEDRDAMAKWINTNSDYVYVGNGRKMKDVKADEPVAWENPAGASDGIAILFADGHAEFIKFPMALDVIDIPQP